MKSYRLPVVLVVDAALVVFFAVLGRATHDEGVDFLGVMLTAGPFLIGTLVGWIFTYLLRSQIWALWPSGVIVYASTVIVGLSVRGLTGGGLAPSFMVVTAIMLAVFILLPRLAFGRVRGRAQEAGVPSIRIADSRRDETDPTALAGAKTRERAAAERIPEKPESAAE